MRSTCKMQIELQRKEVCDLLLACLAAKHFSNDGGEKWSRLHDKLKSQLHELDAQLDDILELEVD